MADDLIATTAELHEPYWDNCLNRCCSGEQCKHRSEACTECGEEWPCLATRLAAELEAARAEVERLRAGLASVEHFARVQALSDRVRSGPARSTYHGEERYWLDLLALIERAEVADV